MCLVGNNRSIFVDLNGKELTEEIIGAAYAVHNELGSGFLEKVYENALAVELRARGIVFRTQAPLKVKYRGEPIGEYFADMIVEDSVICEFKALETVPKEAEVQLVNYLVATGIDIGLLINFEKSVTVRRKFRTTRKKSCQSCTIRTLRRVFRRNRNWTKAEK